MALPYLLAAWIALSASIGPAGAGSGDLSPQTRQDLRGVERWLARFADRGEPFLADEKADLTATMDRLLEVFRATPSVCEPVLLALLDVAGARSKPDGIVRSRPSTAAQRVRSLASRRLHSLYGERPELVAWVGTRVLASGEHPAERRAGAARSLAGVHHPDAMLALFAAGSAEDPELRRAATDTLVDWPNERVHSFLARQLARWVADRHWVDPEPIARTLSEAWLPPDGPGARQLKLAFEQGLESRDWRVCVRTLNLAPAFADPLIVPILIEALASWVDRRDGERGSRRIEGDLVAELQRRSGRRTGPFPDRWQLWWAAVSEGRIQAAQDEETPATRASFFGLRPETDRVAFVIDRSGSMEGPFSQGSSRSRYQEAGRQMLDLLRSLGPETRFRIVLFDHRVHVWQSELTPANERNLERARRWMASKGARGGTVLSPAIREVLRLDSDGRVDLKELEIDTVIVLCDGETQDGPAWVGPLIDAIGEETAIRFHGVQIGGTGDGTLQRLAKLTGGQFLRVTEGS